MINFLRRNRINILVIAIVAIPLCIFAKSEQTDREPIAPKKEYVDLSDQFIKHEETEIIETEEVTEEVMQDETIVVGDSIDTINQEELELLAHLIYAEAGSDWIADETLYYVGSVVLNRMSSDLFPDTMYEVIYQTEPCLQYACTVDGNIEKEPTERCYRIAEDLLRNGSVLPENVIFQSSFKQGSGVYIYVDTIYFCYY